MPPAGGLSKFLTGGLIPLCIWGMICSLLLHLIDIRTLFIQGGEWKLRQGMLAFAAAIILIQRLSRLQGERIAKNYSLLLGISITAFALYHAYAYRIPVHPLLVFAVNEILFIILWWVGHRITAACVVDSELAQEAAVRSGIVSFPHRQPEPPEEELSEKEREEQWAERLPAHHPGRVILYFSLFGIPAFGLGVFLFDLNTPGALLRTGALLFLYLWCAFCLLSLSSLSQLRSYYEKRNVSLPEQIGIPWMAMGFLIVTLVTVVALFLPQPPSIPNAFVRQRVFAVYKGWESRYGVKDTAAPKPAADQTRQMQGQGPTGQPPPATSRQEFEQFMKERYTEVDKLSDEYISELARESEGEQWQVRSKALSVATEESFRDAFDFILKAIAILAFLCGLLVIYAVIVMVGKGLVQNLSSLRVFKKPKAKRSGRRKRKKSEIEELLASKKFAEFTDPFTGLPTKLDGNALVRYMWRALLAFCIDFGTPSEPDQTPYEFIDSEPAALKGFEKQADFIAKIFTFSEFSGETVPESTFPELQQFWSELQSHATAHL